MGKERKRIKGRKHGRSINRNGGKERKGGQEGRRETERGRGREELRESQRERGGNIKIK